MRALIRRNDQIVEELDPADRAAVLEAIATTRRLRAQLRVTNTEPSKPPRATRHQRSPPAG